MKYGNKEIDMTIERLVEIASLAINGLLEDDVESAMEYFEDTMELTNYEREFFGVPMDNEDDDYDYFEDLMGSDEEQWSYEDRNYQNVYHNDAEEEWYEEMNHKATEYEPDDVRMFEVGKIYTTSDWTIGGLIRYTIKDRSKTKVHLIEHFNNIDGIGLNDCGWHDVLINNGIEYVLLGSLYGYEHRLYATE